MEDKNIDLKKNENVSRFLHSHPSTYCSISRFSKGTNWTYKFDQQELNAILKKAQLSPPLKSIEVLQRGLSGRAVALRIKTATGQKVINGELQIRSLFNALPSSLAVFEPQMSGGIIKSLTVIGRGSGHGVGLSQMGAIGRALEGQDYEQILESYYPGTLLTSINH
ncbi:MAG: hypothetical protein R2877_04085 [Bdellovibrionota bacterium]